MHNNLGMRKIIKFKYLIEGDKYLISDETMSHPSLEMLEIDSITVNV